MIRSKVGVDTGSLQVPLTLILKVPPFDGVVVLRMQTPSQRLEEPGCAGDVVPPAAAGLAVSAMQARRVLAMEGIELFGKCWLVLQRRSGISRARLTRSKDRGATCAVNEE
jgi:hypothetical protein